MLVNYKLTMIHQIYLKDFTNFKDEIQILNKKTNNFYRSLKKKKATKVLTKVISKHSKRK
jgi:hypothetical protein